MCQKQTVAVFQAPLLRRQNTYGSHGPTASNAQMLIQWLHSRIHTQTGPVIRFYRQFITMTAGKSFDLCWENTLIWRRQSLYTAQTMQSFILCSLKHITEPSCHPALNSWTKCHATVSLFSLFMHWRQRLVPITYTKKLAKHLSTEETYDKPFKYHFTGCDSRDICRGFHFLLSVIEKGVDDYRIHAIAFAAEQLHEVTSIMSQVNINSEAVTALDMHCKKFFQVMSLFFGAVTPTTWTIGHAVPVHTAQIFAKFGLGLGLNTMQAEKLNIKQSSTTAQMLCLISTGKQHSVMNLSLFYGYQQMTQAATNTSRQNFCGSRCGWAANRL